MAANEEDNLVEYEARQYQIDLFKAAKEKNIIACLGTGTGKTFISILLMSDPQYLSQLKGNYIGGPAKRTFFLVPTRPLVQQQRLAIVKAPQTSDLKVGAISGDMNVDFWDKFKWDSELDKSQVIVMTPQILLDMLNHKYITFDKINLLVVDEVHWAARKKNKKESGHPYKQIMNRYNELDPDSRPRVLGLSATPINCTMRVENFTEAVEDIEKTYSAVCMTGDVGTYGTNPKEIVWSFTNCEAQLSPSAGIVVKSLEKFITFLKTSLKSFKDQRKCPTVLIRTKKILSTIKNILSDPDKNERTTTDKQTGEKFPLFMTWMGVWCTSVAVRFYIKEINDYKQVYQEVDPLQSELWTICVKYLAQIQKTLEQELKSDAKAALTTASPKMLRLLEVLSRYLPYAGQESTLCGIVFVNQRCVAKVLCDWLMELKRIEPHKYGFLNVGWVVGHSARPGIEVKLAANSDKKQQEVIKQFHLKEFNLLVATSVLEEGLDVRKCNLVVRFDRLNTFREYLQSKGRARAEDAHYYIMTADDDSHKLCSKLNDFRQMEEMVKNINNKQNNGTPIIRNEEEDPDLFYKSRKSGAIITARSAVSLLYKYCQKLPSDSFTRLEPVFTLKEIQITPLLRVFQGVVKLPVNCPLPIRSIEGPVKRDRDTAKRAVALKACKKLHEIDELDDYLVPVNRAAIIRDCVVRLGLRVETLDNDEAQRKEPTKQNVGTRSRKDTVVKQIAQIFANDSPKNDHYLHRIAIEFPKTDALPNNGLTLGVITNKPIVNSSLFAIYLRSFDRESVSEVKVQFCSLNKLNVSVEQKESIEKFHCYVIEEVMRFSVKDFTFDPKSSDFNLLIVPLINGRAIDWSLINRINICGPIEMREVSAFERKRYNFNAQSFNDCVFYPWYRKDQEHRPILNFYYSFKVTDLSSRSGWHNTEFHLFDDYFSKKHKIDIKNKDQPLIEGKIINRNDKKFKGAQLKSYSTGKKDKDHVEYFPPELLTILPFPASLWRQALCLPAILYRMNHLYLAEELRQKINWETKPRIGSSNTTNNLEMYFKSSKDVPKSEPNHLKRQFDPLDSDDECEGHDFIDETYVIRLPAVKRQRRDTAITIERPSVAPKTTTGRQLAINTICNVGGGDTSSSSFLLQFTSALIHNFNQMMISFVNGDREQVHAAELQQVLQDIYSVQATNFPDLRYGEAFPFVFKGQIEEHIRHKYDGRVDDPILGPSADVILQALTMVGANDAFNLERLEVIGDSFLKLVTSAFVYFSCPELDEGQLSYLRQIQICNCNLYYIGREKQIDKLLVSHKWFPNSNWLLPSYDISQEKDLLILETPIKNRTNNNNDSKNNNKRTDSFKHRIINNKSVADSIEALIGAHLLAGGNKSALIFMEWLGLKVVPLGAPAIDYENKRNLKSQEMFRWLPLPKPPISRSDLSTSDINDFLRKDFDGANLENFENIIDYKFRNKAYLIQALTHSSYHFNEFTDCYQKLEFLGDAIIDYLISRHIFATPNKQFNPGQLTDLRSALVNNSFFAAIAVKYKFHKFLKNLSPDLFRAIQSFERSFSAGQTESVIKSFSKLTEDECTDIEEIEVPKALGDIFESVAGAIFLDNGLSLDGVWKVYYKLLKPEIDYFTEHIPQMPVKLIWEVCPDGHVKFGDSERVGLKTRVVLKANGKEYGGVGRNRKFAKIAASKNALKDLKPFDRQ